MPTDQVHRSIRMFHWVIAMTWNDLLFAHWPIRVDLLRPLIPPSLDIDTFDGQAWISVVPFRLTGFRLRFAPSLPWFSNFLEINVRTYVSRSGRHGVWFFSLDAASRLAVRGARWTFHLPYYDARMSLAEDHDGIRYSSTRIHRGAPPASFAARYQPVGPAYYSAQGTIDHWLTERYCLYASDRGGRIYYGDIHHHHWPLQPAEAEIKVNTMTEPFGFKLPRVPFLLHFSRRLEVFARGLKQS
jgi:uncharacterized protein YqjF (DUF2071 family)